MPATFRCASRLFCLLIAFVTPICAAQDFPTKPIRFIVGQAPGTLLDVVGRVMTPEMAKILGQPVVVENRPGASGLIAYELVAKSLPADGYTLAPVSRTQLSAFPVMFKELRFDPIKDFPPIIGFGESAMLFGSSSQLPWKTFNEMVAYAKANPGKLNYGSAGALLQLMGAVLFQGLGIDVVNTPAYASGPAYFQALTSGDVHIGLVSPSSSSSFGDRFRVLAITDTERRPPWQDVPTFTELGYPQIESLSYSLHGPAGIPKGAFDKLHAASSRAMQQPDVRSRFAKLDMKIVELSPEETRKKILEQARYFADVARKTGFQPQ